LVKGDWELRVDIPLMGDTLVLVGGRNMDVPAKPAWAGTPNAGDAGISNRVGIFIEFGAQPIRNHHGCINDTIRLHILIINLFNS